MSLDLHRVLCPLTEVACTEAAGGGGRNIKMNLMALGPYEPPDGLATKHPVLVRAGTGPGRKGDLLSAAPEQMYHSGVTAP
jgi:hypothetical protein